MTVRDFFVVSKIMQLPAAATPSLALVKQAMENMISSVKISNGFAISGFESLLLLSFLSFFISRGVLTEEEKGTFRERSRFGD